MGDTKEQAPMLDGRPRQILVLRCFLGMALWVITSLLGGLAWLLRERRPALLLGRPSLVAMREQVLCLLRPPLICLVVRKTEEEVISPTVLFMSP